MPGLPGLIRLRQALGHDGLQPYAAGLLEYQFATRCKQACVPGARMAVDLLAAAGVWALTIA
jgi:hypothetical protein